MACLVLFAIKTSIRTYPQASITTCCPGLTSPFLCLGKAHKSTRPCIFSRLPTFLVTRWKTSILQQNDVEEWQRSPVSRQSWICGREVFLAVRALQQLTRGPALAVPMGRLLRQQRQATEASRQQKHRLNHRSSGWFSVSQRFKFTGRRSASPVQIRSLRHHYMPVNEPPLHSLRSYLLALIPMWSTTRGRRFLKALTPTLKAFS